MRRIFWFLGLLAMGVAGCSGVNSTGTGMFFRPIPTGTGSTATPASTHGTAAIGQPLANATVTLIDANGNTVSTTTASDGSYSLDVTGLQPPFLIETVGSGQTLFSIVAAPGTANVTPLTNLITDLLFESEGTTPAAVVATLGSGGVLPPGTAIQAVTQFLVSNLTPSLQANGIDPSTFDPIQSAFVANGTGEDALLDTLVVSTSTTDGTTVTNVVVQGTNTSQTTSLTVTASASAPSVAATTSTSTGGNSTTTSSSTVFGVAAGSPVDAAGQAVGALATQMASLANQDTGNLGTLEVDLLPLFATNFINDGQFPVTGSAFLAQQLAPLSGLSAQVVGLSDFNSAQNTIVATIAFSGTVSGQATVVDFTNVFQLQTGGTALVFGDQQQVAFQTRIVTLVPGDGQLNTLSLAVSPNQSSTQLSGIGISGVTSLAGVSNQDLVAPNSSTIPQGLVYAVLGGSVTTFPLNAQTGEPTTLNPSVAIVDQTQAPLTGGSAAATNGTDLLVAGTRSVFDIPVSGASINASAQSLGLGATLTSISDNVFGPVFVAANGVNTQAFQINPGAPPSLLGSAASLSGVSTDSVVADANFLAAGSSLQQLVVAAGAATGNQFGPGINLGSAEVAAGGGFSNPASAFISLPGATNPVVHPTALAFVFASSAGGAYGNPLFLVVGTDDPTVSLLVVPINQQTGALNSPNLTTVATPDGQGVCGLTGCISRNNPSSGNNPNFTGNNAGFTPPSVVVAVTGSGAGTAQDVFGYEVNANGALSLLFDQVGLLGNEASDLNGNPAVMTSFAP